MGNASCVELGEDLLRLPDGKLPNKGKVFKLKKTVSLLYQPFQGKYQISFDMKKA